jgi:sulfite exporter TauE/SafE
MTVAQAVFLQGAGAAAGIVGPAGGTASLISYPALLAVGIPPLPANVTNAVAFVTAWPGSASGSRPELDGQGPWLRRWAPLAVAGSAVGAALLLVTPARAFGQAVPFLLAFAALALLLQPKASAWLARHPASSRRLLLPGGLIVTSAYDGYWGAGAGIMTLALLMITTGSSSPVQRPQEHVPRHRRRDLLRRVHPVLARRLGGRSPNGCRRADRQHDRAVPDPAHAPARTSHHRLTRRTRARHPPMGRKLPSLKGRARLWQGRR